MVSEIFELGVIKLDSEQFRLNLAPDIGRNFSAESIQRDFSYDGICKQKSSLFRMVKKLFLFKNV